MILAGTGHRPNRLSPQLLAPDVYLETVHVRLVALATAALRRYRPDGVLSGMAIGWDQALAHAAIACDIPWQAYVPFIGQEIPWPAPFQRMYQQLLDAAGDIHYAAAQFSMQAYLTRNTRMIDNADAVVALWSGTAQGGTAHAVAYARTVGKPVYNLWKSWLQYR